MEKDLFVRRVYQYKGVAVCVEIDYVKQQITLVEKNGDNYKPKEWLFAQRELKYLPGWILILDAMKNAITAASELLNAHSEKQALEFAEMLIALDKHNLKNPTIGDNKK